MRRESKYHYVDLALIDDQLEGHEGDQGLGYVVGASENAAARR